MYNFDQTFLAKIQGIWTGVKGQIIEGDAGWKFLICKRNGFTYWIYDNYERCDNASEEEIRQTAIRHNTADLNYQIYQEKQRAKQNNSLPRWRVPSVSTRILEEALQNARSAGRSRG